MTILRNDISKIIFLSILSLVLFLPFFNKAISADSIFYIYTAKQILKEPLDPFNFQISCADRNYAAWDIANNPPLISYFLAALMKVFGEKEEIFHIVFFGFTLFAVIGIYMLAKILNIDSFFSALLLIASPAFFVNATDIMLDIPLMAFSLWGIYFAIKEQFIGWILLGLALLIKFVAVINLPIVFVWFLLNKKLKQNVIFFIIPILFLIIWSIHNKLTYDEIQLFNKSLSVGLSFDVRKEIPVLTYIGGAFIFPLSILWLSFQRKRINIIIFLFMFIITNIFFNLLGYKTIQNLLFGVFICSAVFLIYIIIDYLKKSHFQREIIFLTAWSFLYIFFFVSVSAIIAVRYLLPLAPAVILLFVKIAEKVSNRKVFLIFTIVIGIIISIFISHSDCVLANSYRETANYLKTNYPDKIFFRGDLSFRGLQYYMEKNGFICIDVYSSNNLSGSYIVKSDFSITKELTTDIKKNMEFIEKKYITTKNPFRTMSPSVQAGFHLNMYGLLPYSFSKAPIERFIIYRVK
ncbi:MAG: glycosyltransferase family 39 protein [Elusimicrobia bacterium]|nr:glycosyltransferase family 39 protein [Elusimicrobiota bacterium]